MSSSGRPLLVTVILLFRAVVVVAGVKKEDALGIRTSPLEAGGCINAQNLSRINLKMD